VFSLKELKVELLSVSSLRREWLGSTVAILLICNLTACYIKVPTNRFTLAWIW